MSMLHGLPRLFDSHAHYQDAAFDALSGGREKVLAEVFARELCGIVNAATDLPSSRQCVEMAAKYLRLYAAVGVHPEDCGKTPEEEMERTLSELESLCRQPKVVAVGEIGLDYYWPQNPPREVQKRWFEAQLALAEKTGLPVVVHDREAHGDTLELLLSHPAVRGVLHSFSGSREMAEALLRRGWYFSFSGVITFKNAVRPAQVLKSLPLDRILTETDCPYLAPVPLRGKTNRSDYMRYTVEKEAEILGIDYEEFAEITVKNAAELFRISTL